MRRELTGAFDVDAFSPSDFVEVGLSVSFLFPDFISNFDPGFDTPLFFAFGS